MFGNELGKAFGVRRLQSPPPFLWRKRQRVRTRSRDTDRDFESSPRNLQLFFPGRKSTGKDPPQNKSVHLNKFFWTISLGFLTRVTEKKAKVRANFSKNLGHFGILGGFLGLYKFWVSKGGFLRAGSISTVQIVNFASFVQELLVESYLNSNLAGIWRKIHYPAFGNAYLVICLLEAPPRPQRGHFVRKS